MEHIDNTSEKSDFSQMWEGMYYLTFFIFSTLFVIPNMPKAYTFNNYYPIAMVVYGAAGVFVGIAIYRLVRSAPDWMKWSIIIVLYIAVIYQLVTHIDQFAVPDL